MFQTCFNSVKIACELSRQLKLPIACIKLNLSKLALSSGVARNSCGPIAITPLSTVFSCCFRLISEKRNTENKGFHSKSWGP